MYKRSLLILLAIAATAAVCIFWQLSSNGQSEVLSSLETSETIYAESDASDNTASALPRDIAVYISGEVNAPGVVSLPDGSRIADAVKACGGFTASADKASVNLAQKAEDGMQINVAAVNFSAPNTAASSSAAASAKSSGSMVNLNTAAKEELDTLPGIGPAMADRIIEYREQNGNFKAIEDVKNVKGIGEAKFAKMKDRLCI